MASNACLARDRFGSFSYRGDCVVYFVSNAGWSDGQNVGVAGPEECGGVAGSFGRIVGVYEALGRCLCAFNADCGTG